VNVVADRDAYLDPQQPFTEQNWNLSLFPPDFSFLTPHTVMHLEGGGSIVIKGPRDKVFSDLGLGDRLNMRAYGTGGITPDGQRMMRYTTGDGSRLKISKGQVIARGIIEWGDHVIVNKFAYHFRQPTRGEVFVFTTKNINSPYMNIPREQGSQHYIKRLGGVPGDTLDIKPPELYHNGNKAVEPGFRRVIDEGKGAPHVQGYYGYQGYSGDHHVELPITLSNTSPKREYFALGDNSYNSSDSRYWGPVPEQNLVGPGWFCYWPLTKHWGVIK
jgi:signal peptidase I